MKRPMRIFAMFTAAVLLVALAAAAGVQRGSARMRANLEKQVRHEILMQLYYGVFDWIGFTVEGERAILSGEVTRPVLKDSIEKAVKGLEAVASVENRIEVLPLSSGDDRIRRAVSFALYGQNSLPLRYGMGSQKAIHIIVRNGHVRLVGSVNSEADKNIAGRRASRVWGTFSVTNDLTVAR